METTAILFFRDKPPVSLSGLLSKQLDIMSRAAMSKSRAEKSRTTSVSVSQAVGQTAPPDVVQGRLTEAEWVSMVAQEEGEEAVAEVFDVLMARVMEECYRAYLKKQVRRHTFNYRLIHNAAAQYSIPAY